MAAMKNFNSKLNIACHYPHLPKGDDMKTIYSPQRTRRSESNLIMSAKINFELELRGWQVT